jgi:hypothetical protein
VFAAPLASAHSRLVCQGNAENFFSTAGNLSDPNMDPHFLAILSAIAKNKSVYKLSISAIKEKYYAKFRGGASSSKEDEEK